MEPTVTHPVSVVPPQRRWFASCHAKHSAYSARVTPDDLTKWEFWTPNTKYQTWAVLVDVDTADARDRLTNPRLPTPSWIVLNPANGHAQAGWIIEPVAHGAQARPKPQQFLKAVADVLKRAVGGDPHFSGARCRNPFFSGYTVLWGPLEARSLGTLRKQLHASGLWEFEHQELSVRAQRLTKAYYRHGERNVAVFDAVRFAAYAGETDLESVAASVQMEGALAPNEVAAIIRSVEDWVGSKYSRGHEAWGSRHDWLAGIGRRGGLKGGRTKTGERLKALQGARAVRSAQAVLRAEEARMLRAEGKTFAAIAAQLKVSTKTVQRYLAQAVAKVRLDLNPERVAERIQRNWGPTVDDFLLGVKQWLTLEKETDPITTEVDTS